MIKIIAAIGTKNELGKAGDLIWHLPNDLKFFKQQTDGCPVVMGRNTFNSLPKKLPNRKHYVITDSLTFNKDVNDVNVYFAFDDMLEKIKCISKTQDVFIIGGASIYRQFMEYADELILTEVDATDEGADVYFPTFDKTKYTRHHISFNEDNGIKYEHVKYVKK